MRSCSLLFLLACGCPPVDPGPGDPFDCELGLVDEGGAFAPMTPDEPLELVLGFQGFLFVEAWIRGVPDAPRDNLGSFQIAPTDHTPSTSTVRVLFDEQDTSGPLNIFLEASELAALTDRPAALAARLEGDGGWCLATADVLLVDDDDCIHTTETDECVEPDEP